jgi:hypothetical protein
METLTVWGYKNGRAKILFANLAENVSCIARAKRTASEQGYKIIQVVRNASSKNGYIYKDVTEKFLSA